MVVFLNKTYKHLVEIDHWEKDDLGYCYMVDVQGRKWWGEHHTGSNRYSIDTLSNGKERPVARKMRQNNKYMVFLTYDTDEVKNQGYITGWTITKDAMFAEYFLLGSKVAEDSINTILEALLK